MNIDYSLDEIQKVARLVAKVINSDIILLSGEVGVGKTTLIKEILKILKVNDNVNSPTFSIINEYLTRDKKIVSGTRTRQKIYLPVAQKTKKLSL